MKPSDMKMLFGGRLFIWSPYGYRVFGFFHKGRHYALWTLRWREGWFPKAQLERPGTCRYLNVERRIYDRTGD